MKNEVVFDIETEKSFDEVGGRDKLHLLGVTVVGAYDYNTGVFQAFEREEFGALARLFKNASRIIGFNIRSFDIPALDPYIDINMYSLPFLDLMDDVERSAGFRISLDNLARTTLGAAKLGHGLDAITWWREGKKDKVKEYCLQDVRLTRDLYEYGKKHGEVFFESRQFRRRTPLIVQWNSVRKDARGIVRDGLEKRRSIVIEYAPNGSGAASRVEKRTIDVYAINRTTFEGFCHTQKAKRVFALENIKTANITDQPYKLEEDVQQSLL